ncbi:hypothetical protein XHC_2345 [Xanthomonas hortorum pv. carotae str. M081]|nr:hypothetical protein XHC_2345 [Xanthomonas hortorum pv. carotae str. M081]
MDDLARIPASSAAGTGMLRRRGDGECTSERSRDHPSARRCSNASSTRCAAHLQVVFSSLHTMQFVDLVGWLASAVLIATLIRQIYKQWQSPAAQGVSRWLFVGQISASVLFIVYSYLVGNAVFIVSNALILLTAITGYVLQRIKHRQLRGIS